MLLTVLALVLFGQIRAVVAQQDDKGGIETADNTFLLTAIRFNKVRFIQSFESYQIYEPYLGSRVNISELRAICKTITQMYQEKGFLATECVLPPQTIKDGIVNMYLIEGVVGRVRLTGDGVNDDGLLRSYIGQIQLNHPLEAEQVNRVKKLIAALSGISLNVYTRPMTDPQKLELVFEVKKYLYDAELYLNNRGSKIVGPVQAGFAVSGHSLLGMHESIKLNVLGTQETSELKYFELNSVWPVGTAGSSVIFGASYAESHPGDFLTVLDIDATISGAKLGWASPIVWEDNKTLSFTSQIEYFKSDATTGAARFELNELYKIRLSLNSKIDHMSAYTEANVSIVQALSGLNTTTTAASGFKSTGQEAFTAFKFDVYYSTALLSNLLFSFQTQGQYGSSVMPVSEYIAFGGEVMGSAYDPAEFFGNHGLGGKARLAYRLTNSWLSSGYTQLFIQNDVVKTWNEMANITSSGASLAAGVILGSGSFYLEMQLAKPLTKPVLLEANNDLRYFMSFRYFF